MVRGDASRVFACTDQRKRKPAKYCAKTRQASPIPNPLRKTARQLRPDLAGRCQAAVLALGLIIDFLDVTLMALHAELNHHINQEIEKILDVGPRELLPAATLLDQEHQLLECQFSARRVHARDRSWVPRVHVSQVIERLLGAKLSEQYAVGLHAKTALEQLLRCHPRQALI